MYYNINIVIADDHEIFLDGLALMLSGHPGFNVCGRASNGQQLQEVVDRENPDIVLTDIRMPAVDGIQSTKHILAAHPGIGVIALSMFDEENLIIEMLEAGAKGYLLKNAHKDEIIDAVISVYQNKNYYCSQTSFLLATMIVRSKFNPHAMQEPAVNLNDREKTIIKLICLQQTTQQIADQIFLSKRTVEGYRVKILEKIQAKNIAGVVIFALKNNIIKEEDVRC
ncbi:response regulator transcription factor [Pedobacter cryoconitis]|uniref:DNA-binding NarL/FixJ family response regulator n=1 Tax=Pedobacter cryoconitis TaxID=188932 RepID=A0A7X0J3Z5_9SPHI|nr:response regulator transcription factor [Pedobacter cryoconitis]MBB6500620.1 DNA-binding NarL/FixJ family response regulator [Pedobacter cryoconitis]